MPKHDKNVHKMLANGLKPKEIAAKTGLTLTQVYSSSGRYNAIKNSSKVTDIVTNTDKYHEQQLDIYKRISLSVGNSITEEDIKKSSLAQKTVIMATITDKVRLIEGKSTSNIAVDVIAGLDNKTLEKLEDLSRSLIKSMLKDNS